MGGILRTPEGKIDYTQDFFEKPSFLTVSGQLNAEYYACALSNVYTFGPTFRQKSYPRISASYSLSICPHSCGYHHMPGCSHAGLFLVSYASLPSNILQVFITGN